MSKRKPYNNDAGYVASLKCPDGGHLVIYDRKNGGDWIDAGERWILSRYNAGRMNEGLLEFPSLRAARSMMKATVAGENDWYEPLDVDV